MGQSSSSTCTVNNVTIPPGPELFCASETCCQYLTATYDSIPDTCNIGYYGNLTYENFNVGAPFANPPAIEPHSSPHFARGSAAKSANSSLAALPGLSFDIAEGNGFGINSMYSIFFTRK